MWPRLILLGLALLTWGGDARASSPATAWSRGEQAEVRLIVATRALSGTRLDAGLQFRMRPGWKTYWRSPGDAGFAARVDWSRSTNVAHVEMRWPAPHRFTLFGLETFGYADEVVLPLEIIARDAARPMRLVGHLEYLVCEAVCVPLTAELTLDVPVGPPQTSEFAPLIERYAALVPGDGGGGLSVRAVAFRAGVAPELEIALASNLPLGEVEAIVEGPEGWTFGRPRIATGDDGSSVALIVPARGGPRAPPLIGRQVTVTVTDGDRGVEQIAAIEAATTAPVDWLAMIGLALLGGLILNLMPCVLPVLSLKLMAVLRGARADRGAVRIGFLASAAGIFAAFAVLAAGLIGVRATGAAIGWGLQFQSPVFLAFMAMLVTLFAANLWGWLEIALPGVASDAIERGLAGSEHTGAWASFAQGALATLLATPCSAPFLGTAVGFALSRGPVEIAAIFAAIALGLAMPFLMLAAMPGLAGWLPRPGRWMARLRLLLGFALAVTAGWLLWVIAGQSLFAAIMIGLLAIVLLVVMYALRRHQDRWRWMAGAPFAAALLIAAMIGPAPPRAPPAGLWRDFDRGEIAAAVAQGRTVFVDVTADWCITCRVNEALIIDSDQILARLSAPDVVAMRADWTRPDAEIAAFLASYRRYGIPFNVVFGPGAPAGLVLPELLSTQAVSQALDRAGRPRS